MSSVDFKALDKKLKSIAGLKQAVMPKAFDFFKNITPIRSGNAKNNTRLVKNTIEAKYNYASVLDAGRGYRNGQMRGSTQAPQGMSKPTQKEVAKLVKQYIKTLGK